MRHLLVATLLACCATPGHAVARECTAADATPAPTRHATSGRGTALAVQRCIRYQDKSGDWQLYLSGSNDRRDGDHVLSTEVAVQLFRRQVDGSLSLVWDMKDRIAKGEAGMWFSRKLSEFRDLDHSGEVTPLLVLRYVSWTDDADPSAGVKEDDDAGRLRIVVVRPRTSTVVAATVEAVSGTLDDERRTTANDAYFALPAQTRLHVQHLLRDWNRNQVFLSADNRGGFVPRHEKKRR